MKKILFLASIVICGLSVVRAEDNKAQSSCKSMPMKAGIITYKTPTPIEIPKGTLVVGSTDDKVYSLSTGQVMSAMKVTDASKASFNVIVVRYTTDSFIAYSNLADLSVKKGDMIKKGQVLAKATPNAQSGKNEVGVAIYTGKDGKPTANALIDPFVLAFISRADN